jgi:hypothetical protein
MRSGYKFEAKRSPNGHARKYQTQYDNAKYHAIHIRNIDWQFTYDTWVEWWGEDITKRGPYKGQLVMARNGDIGPYHPDNVHKVTSTENHKERKANGGEMQRIAAYKVTCAKRKEKETV